MSGSGPGDMVASAARIEPLLLGTTVSGGAIAATAGHASSAADVVLAILGSVLVYWAAHLHAATLADEIESGGRLRTVVADAVAQTWRIPAASLLPVVTLVAATLLGAELRTAAWLAIGVTGALLGALGYLAGRRAGLGSRGRAASTLGGLAVGVLIIGLKASLH